MLRNDNLHANMFGWKKIVWFIDGACDCQYLDIEWDKFDIL